MIPGIHVSTAGGIHRAPGRLRELGLSAGQIFTASQRRWESPPLPESEIEMFRNQARGMIFVSHASYLINPASSREDVRLKSGKAMVEELIRCSLLGIPFLVLHPGAHQNAGVPAGIRLVAEAVARAVSTAVEGPMVLLENTAGAGTTLGSSLEELAEIRDLSGIPERMGFCIDTAHAHGAGFTVGSRSFSRELRSVLGAENIKAFHMNGSMVEKGSRRDRHQHFTGGTIQLGSLKVLYDDPYFSRALGIAETPGTDEDRATDMGMLINEG